MSYGQLYVIVPEPHKISFGCQNALMLRSVRKKDQQYFVHNFDKYKCVVDLDIVFTALRGMQKQSSDENSAVRLSICLSNAFIVTKRKKDMSRFLYYTKVH